MNALTPAAPHLSYTPIATVYARWHPDTGHWALAAGPQAEPVLSLHSAGAVTALRRAMSFVPGLAGAELYVMYSKDGDWLAVTP